MASFNRVILVGNLTRDPELRYIPSGTAVSDIGLAVNDRVKKGDQWVDEVTFVDITLWGRTAEIANEYLSKGLIARDPFVTIDVEGMGELVRIAAERGRKSRTKLKLGICGEHGGDPDSIRFCHDVGLDYVSCSPFRVPVARLAAAQAALARPKQA